MSEHSQHELDDELISAYVDGELTDDERATVEARLATDPAARQLLGELQRVSKSVRDLPSETIGRDLRDSILLRAVDAKQNGVIAESRGAESLAPSFGIGRTRRAWFWASLAVAAALLVMVTQDNVERNDNTLTVAEGRRERPSISARSEQPARLAVEEASRDLAEAEIESMDRVAGSASTSVPSPPRGGVATTPMSSADMADDAQRLVVHVMARPAAIQNRSFDKLLVSNGIAVEAESPARALAAMPDRGRAVAPTNTAPHAGTETAEPMAKDDENLDVVLVEAPATTILSCLSDLSQDYANYSGVSVDDSSDSPDAAGAEAAIAGKLKVDLNKFSRGVVPAQQKLLFSRRGDGFYSQFSRDEFGFAGSGIERKPQTAASDMKEKSLAPALENLSNQSRAQRFQVSKADPQQLDELRKVTNQQKSPAQPADENLQVLFVLTPSDEAAASPAAENPPQ